MAGTKQRDLKRALEQLAAYMRNVTDDPFGSGSGNNLVKEIAELAGVANLDEERIRRIMKGDDA